MSAIVNLTGTIFVNGIRGSALRESVFMERIVKLAKELEFEESGGFIRARIPSYLIKAEWLSKVRNFYKALMSHKEINNMRGFAVCGSAARYIMNTNMGFFDGIDIFFDADYTHKALFDAINKFTRGNDIRRLSGIEIPTPDRIRLPFKNAYNIILENPLTVLKNEEISIRKLGIFFEEDTTFLVTTNDALNDFKNKMCHYPIYYALDVDEGYEKLKERYPETIGAMSREDVYAILKNRHAYYRCKSESCEMRATEKTENFDKLLQKPHRFFNHFERDKPFYMNSELCRSFFEFISGSIRSEFKVEIEKIEKFDRKALIEYVKNLLKKKHLHETKSLMFVLSEKKILIDEKEDKLPTIMRVIFASGDIYRECGEAVTDILLTIIEGAFVMPGQPAAADELRDIAGTLSTLAEKLV